MSYFSHYAHNMAGVGFLGEILGHLKVIVGENR